MFRLQSEQVDANPNSFGFQYGSLEYQNLQCENSIHVNRKHYVTQNDQGGAMHYTLKVYRLRTHWLKHYPSGTASVCGTGTDFLTFLTFLTEKNEKSENFTVFAA